MKNRPQFKIFLLIIITAFLSCKDSVSQKKSKVPKIKTTENKILTDKIENTKLQTNTYKLNNGQTILIENNKLSILNSKGKTILTNNNIIRVKDGNQQCISDGFQKITSKGDFFTVEQQNCSNKYIIGEYITFKYNKNSNNYHLSKIGYTYVDKKNPENKISDKIYTPNDFGEIKLKDLNHNSLYVDLINKK